MSRKLVALNLLLVAAIGSAGWKLYENWRLARAREQAFLQRQVRPGAAPPVQAVPPPKPIQASSYLDIALRMLFSSDRNPTVVVEEAPPSPVPAFPAAFGVIDFGDGPFVLMTEKTGGPQKSFRPGDKVGEFTLVSVSAKELVFEWDGKQFPKAFEELKPKQPVEAAPSAQTPTTSPLASSASDRPVSNPAPVSRNQQITPKEVVEEAQRPRDGGPGIDVGGFERPCAPGDTSAPGSVQGGWRKVVTQSPFGSRCYWVPVRQ